MSGITDPPFRTIARRFHRGLLHTEMISAEALCRGSKRTLKMSVVGEGQRPCAIQLVGHDPVRLGAAAKIAAGLGADFIDLNAGCPEPKVTKTGGGGALLKDIPRLEKAVRAMCASADVPVSVKLRLGWDRDVSSEALAAVESAGASHVTFHGRLVAQGFSGEADWGALALLAASADVPLLANGDARDAASACELLRTTGAAGVMLGRCTRGRPHMPAAAFDVLEGRVPRRLDGAELADTIVDHARLEADVQGERRGILKMRKHVHWYLAAARAEYPKAAVHRLETVAELRKMLDGVRWRD
jgi:nifR3 family TIM-barrel protein